MGGLGSGRTEYASRPTLECYPAIYIRDFAKKGWLKNPQRKEVLLSNNLTTIIERDSKGLKLGFELTTEGIEPVTLTYDLPVLWTPCYLGGARPWFECPSNGCKRKTTTLFFSGRFACRQCLDLKYRSQRANKHTRRILKADKIRKRLRWQPGIARPDEDKPLKMHWKTYERLKVEHDLLKGMVFRSIVNLHSSNTRSER